MNITRIFRFFLMMLLITFFFLSPEATCNDIPDSPKPTPSTGTPQTSPSISPPPSLPSGLVASPSLEPSPGISPSPGPTTTPGEPVSQPNEERNEFEKILSKMKAVNEELKDYSASFNMKMKVKYSFLELPINLEGNYYFKSPDKHKIKVNRAPNFLAQYPQVFGWSLPHPKDFTGKVKGEENGCKILKLVPIMGMGDLLKIEIWVDKNTYRYPRQVYYYRDGGKIAIDISYKNVGGYYLFDRLNGTFEFPKNNIKASGEAIYKSYKINQGIPDSFFEKKEI